MYKTVGVTVVTAAIGVTALTIPAHAGDSAVGAGLLGFGIGAVVGSALAPGAVYVAPPPPPVYYAPPPPPVYYGPAVYVSPGYRYSYRRHYHR
jgi:hypothetical protein